MTDASVKTQITRHIIMGCSLYFSLFVACFLAVGVHNAVITPTPEISVDLQDDKETSSAVTDSNISEHLTVDFPKIGYNIFSGKNIENLRKMYSEMDMMFLKLIQKYIPDENAEASAESYFNYSLTHTTSKPEEENNYNLTHTTSKPEEEEYNLTSTTLKPEEEPIVPDLPQSSNNASIIENITQIIINPEEEDDSKSASVNFNNAETNNESPVLYQNSMTSTNSNSDGLYGDGYSNVANQNFHENENLMKPEEEHNNQPSQSSNGFLSKAVTALSNIWTTVKDWFLNDVLHL